MRNGGEAELRSEERREKREERWAGHPHPFRFALLDECKYDVQFDLFLAPLDEG